ncbi:pectinesterase/pectinesterase inhibitor PPE8B-like [Lycium barbarum]|uniref:pectinesterase/pectinesterase inhibitor PPE8B-like n=1 Tax=Lycium barbarum TaxID=112863 RepID=UPI00293E67E5|nr:pectinesterase/pectinesterase inhibitor PPE8B-like [Lycium barbarum]
MAICVIEGIGQMKMLQSLDLSRNQLSGVIPQGLANLTFQSVLDLSECKVLIHHPIVEMFNLHILSLRFNKFYGSIPSIICQLQFLQILDLSANGLSGNIPQCFNNFTLLYQDDSSGEPMEFIVQVFYGKILRHYSYISDLLIQWKTQESVYLLTASMRFTTTIVMTWLSILCYGDCQQITQPPNATVALDGTGNYTAIMAAVLAAPNNSVAYYYIKIKQGTYNEYVQIESWKTNIVFIGEGMGKTIISGNKSYVGGIGKAYTATVGVNGQGFIAQGITFRNIAGAKMLQAVALRAEAEFLTFYQCRFEGYQDTLYTKYDKQFYRDCDILGTIDFMCGDASAVFQNCLIEVREPLRGQYITITAEQKDHEAARTGLVLQNCTLKAIPDLVKAGNITMYLGRPWGNFSTTVIMQSYIELLINPRGWIEFEGRPLVRPFYMEYRNRGQGADTKGRVKWENATDDSMVASRFTFATSTRVNIYTVLLLWIGLEVNLTFLVMSCGVSLAIHEASSISSFYFCPHDFLLGLLLNDKETIKCFLEKVGFKVQKETQMTLLNKLELLQYS